MKTLEYLDEAKKRLGVQSDYALAKALHVTHSAMSNYRAERSRIDDTVALKVASILAIDPLEIIAAANAERAKTAEMRKIWTDLMEKISVGFEVLVSAAIPRRRTFSA